MPGGRAGRFLLACLRATRLATLGLVIACVIVAATATGRGTVVAIHSSEPELPPEAAAAICRRQGLPLAWPPEARAVARWAQQGGDVLTCANRLCAGLCSLRPTEPAFDPAWIDPGPPRDPLAILAGWRRGQPGTGLEAAVVMADLATDIGLSCRLVASDGGWAGPEGISGVEVWLPCQRSWILIDPWIGIGFNRPGAFLSLRDLRVALRSRAELTLTPMAGPVPATPLGPQQREYSGRVENLWYGLDTHPGFPGRAPRPWGLLLDPLAPPSWAWRARLAGEQILTRWAVFLPPLGKSRSARLAFDLFHVYLTLLVVAGWLSTRGSPPKTPSDRGSALARELARDWAYLAAPPRLGARSVRTALGAMHRLAAGLVLGLTRLRGPLTGLLAWLGQGWRRLQLAGLAWSPGSRLGFAVAACGACVLWCLHLLASRPECWEDAYISLRFARNLAEGHGLTFNAGERGVEGFSNMLWVLLLTAAAKGCENLPQAALAFGVAFGLLHILSIGWMARRMGLPAWVPMLLLSTNPSYLGCCTSGLETAQVALATSMVAWAWMTEEERGERGPRLTALACWFVAVSRPEGWYLFAGISAVRWLEARERQLPFPVRHWIVPFLLPFAAYTLLRVGCFGALVPHVYHARLVAQRGELLYRLAPGIVYVCCSLLANPALLLGIAGLATGPCPKGTPRLVSVCVLHLLMVATAGGDAGYMPHSRFLMPAAGCLALLAALAAGGRESRAIGRPGAPARERSSGAHPGRGRGSLEREKTASNAARSWSRLSGHARSLLVGAAVLAGNAAMVQHPFEAPRLDLAPLVRACAGGFGPIGSWLKDGWEFLENGSIDQSRHSPDGVIARHLVRSIDTIEELHCGQAGQVAFLWPGTFRDFWGLATSRAELPAAGSRSGRRPWLLMDLPHALNHWRQLDSAGCRLVRVYTAIGGSEPPETLFLLLRRGLEGVRLTEELLDLATRRIRWWECPPETVCLLQFAARPTWVYDGVTGKTDARFLPEGSALNLWLEKAALAWGARDRPPAVSSR
ncbi:MAG: hypothetical protein HY814_12235 [Candidatus Riflebacteria bacterium]|nr:hypothetical protein [Candidatus Riflebacteria bacterium]